MTPSHLDLDEDLERPVVIRVPPRRRPVGTAVPAAAAVRYPPGPVPDLEDAAPAAPGLRGLWVAPVRRVAELAPARWARGVLRRRRTWAAARRTGQPSPRSRVLAGLLGVLVGALGLHALYLGHRRRGLWMLGTTLVLGPLTLGLAAVVMGLWGFTEGLLVLGSRRGRFTRDAWGRPLHG